MPAEKNKTEEMPIGTIPIDSIFSPVHQGQLHGDAGARRPRDRLRPALDSRSGPTARVAPADAVAYAAKILKEQLAIFINFEEPVETADAADRASREPLNPNLFTLGRRARAVGALGQLPAERQHPH